MTHQETISALAELLHDSYRRANNYHALWQDTLTALAQQHALPTPNAADLNMRSGAQAVEQILAKHRKERDEY